MNIASNRGLNIQKLYSKDKTIDPKLNSVQGPFDWSKTTEPNEHAIKSLEANCRYQVLESPKMEISQKEAQKKDFLKIINIPRHIVLTDDEKKEVLTKIGVVYEARPESEEDLILEAEGAITLLGSGKKAEVFTCQNNPRYVYRKVRKNSEIFEQKLISSVAIQNWFAQESGQAPRVHKFISTKNNYWIIMDRIKGESLENIYDENVTTQQRLDIGAKILSVAYELNRIGISHQDLHMGNIIIDNENEKVFLIDFDQSKYVGEFDKVKKIEEVINSQCDAITIALVLIKLFGKKEGFLSWAITGYPNKAYLELISKMPEIETDIKSVYQQVLAFRDTNFKWEHDSWIRLIEKIRVLSQKIKTAEMEENEAKAGLVSNILDSLENVFSWRN